MIPALLALLLAPAAMAATPVVSTGAATGVTPAHSTMTVAALYTGDRVRDPFQPASSGGRSAARVESDEPQGPPTADIHALALRGLLKDTAADYALFSAETGEVFMLKAGRLYNDRNKAVPGVTGRINLKQKRVELMTADKDVQTYLIGEPKDKDEEKRP